MWFLGMAGYYRHFCCYFLVITAPLTTLLKKSQSCTWTADSEAAVQKLKLMLYSNYRHLISASSCGCRAGAALMQVDDKGIEHPESYFSHKFNQHQVNYPTIEKEA